MPRVDELPKSEDEVWEDAQTMRTNPVRIPICETHGKDNWTKHVGYKNEGKGVITCTKCPWGTKIPGYMRVVGEKILDLREL
jgi:hypothetical protein